MESQNLGAQDAVAGSVDVFNREYARLQELARDAARRGERVTEANVELAYEPRGAMLTATAAETEFDSRNYEPPLPAQLAAPTPTAEARPAAAEPRPDQPATWQRVREAMVDQGRQLEVLLARLSAKPTGGAPGNDERPTFDRSA